MSTDGIQTIVDGVANAVPAETAHDRAAASAIRRKLRIRVARFIVPSFEENMGVGREESRGRAMRNFRVGVSQVSP
jgi:hypothetical protein